MSEDIGGVLAGSEQGATVAAWEEARSAWLVAQSSAETALHLASDARTVWKKALVAATEAKRLAWVVQKAARGAGGRSEAGEAEARALWAAERAEKSAWIAWDHAKNAWMEESLD